ncbi:hypothetical protein BCR33DRAFT_693188 [Rhizoclosmatium globosum]|uniref:C2H2-type domain-containing protein n=1 Tax=Rhizoclosmatium globosum TaxID=329046 RepID=A0A1Y2D381_9FUNG|nr:hypothetical protein BCR33DRAFT_693188 [Rhizoclosmatium globosum]|eukprot:ORY53751.1 hypothetical protein BCR33DRAFT_693188 [Rhizoclosmatium globosum]
MPVFPVYNQHESDASALLLQLSRQPTESKVVDAFDSAYKPPAAITLRGPGGINLLDSPVLSATPPSTTSYSVPENPLAPLALPQTFELNHDSPPYATQQVQHRQPSVSASTSPDESFSPVSSESDDDFAASGSLVRLSSKKPNSKPRPKKYKCEFAGCDKFFDRPSTLQTHCNEHNNIRPHKCSHCDATFVRKHDKTRHEETHNFAKELPSCSKCNMNFSRLDAKRRHERLCGEFKCHICDGGFARRDSLQRHLRGCTHEPVFSQSYNVKPHFLLHLNIRDFHCRYCPKQFARKRDCERHEVATHLNARKFVCRVCEFGFSRRNALVRHMKNVHGTSTI